MNRRTTIALGALAVAALGTGCTTFSNNDAVARVGDHELTRSELADLMSGDDAPAPSTPSSEPGGENDGGGGESDEPATLSGDEARQLIGLWVQDQLLKSVLADSDGEVTDADRQHERRSLEQQQGFSDLPSQQQDLYVELNTTANVIGRLNFNADEQRASYEAGMQESGVACLGAIIYDSRDEAEAGRAEIEGGADFGDVAGKQQVNPQLARERGKLGCVSGDSLAQQLPAPLIEAAEQTPIGEVSDPVRVGGGGGGAAQWVLLAHLPFDEVRNDLIRLVGQDETMRLVRQKADDLDISVDPRYGSFDIDAGVTALGGAVAPDPALGLPVS